MPTATRLTRHSSRTTLTSQHSRPLFLLEILEDIWPLGHLRRGVRFEMFGNSMDTPLPSRGQEYRACWPRDSRLMPLGKREGSTRAGRKSYLGLQGQDPRGQVDIRAGIGPVTQ